MKQSIVFLSVSKVKVCFIVQENGTKNVIAKILAV